MSRLPWKLAAATLFAGASISMAAPAWAADPAPSQPGNRGSAANGALISDAAKAPRPLARIFHRHDHLGDRRGSDPAWCESRKRV